MKISKNQGKIAKLIFKNSFTHSYIDSTKVKQNLKILTKQKPPQLLNILKIYKKMVAQALSWEEITVESASKITDKNFEKAMLNKSRAKRISYKINPSIVLGLKLTHGDWVYDETLDAKLNQLTKT